MDAFYASVEQLDNPGLKGKPVAVGGSRERGVVAAASYEARKYGVRSAISSKLAKLRCPGLIFVKPRFDRYKEISEKVRTIFFEYTDLVEPLSLDEAFLDVTYVKRGKPSATLIAEEIKERINLETGLTASAGVSYNKFLAKIASDVNKPNGLFVITPEQALEFLEKLEIKKFFGIGKVTAGKLNKMGVWNGSDLKKISRFELIRLFGKVGNFYYEICRGKDPRQVEPFHERKSIGTEQTFQKDLYHKKELEEKMLQIADLLWGRAVKSGVKAKTLTFKFKYSDFKQHTGSKTVSGWISSKEMLITEAKKILNSYNFAKGVRLIGLTLSNFIINENREPVQLTIKF